MNTAGERAIRDAIGYLSDNLYRFKLQQRAMPSWKSGNGEPIADIIASHERSIAELEENLT